jgi:RHS repeat-associated protein
MRCKRSLSTFTVATLVLAGLVVPARAEGPIVTRPIAELFGSHIGYGFAGEGVATATGNYVRQYADLTFPVALLGWVRTYNSFDDTTAGLGRGWTATYFARLTSNADGSVRFKDDDGRVLVFTPQSGGGFARPLDLLADLNTNADGTFTLRYLTGDVWNFDPSGRAMGRTAEGVSLSFAYDTSDRLASVGHSAGYRLDLTYDGNARIIRVAASDGRAVAYTYGTDGALATVTGPGFEDSYTTGTDGRLRTVVDGDGRTVLTNAYDAQGRVSHQDYGPGGAVDLSYNPDAGTMAMTVAGSGAQVSFRHDAAGHLVHLTDPAGNSTQQAFDANGRITSVTSLGGLAATYTYDARGDVTSKAVGGATSQYQYDAQDRLTRLTDPSGAATSFQYTGSSRVPARMTDPAGATTTNTIVDGLITSTVDSTGATTRYTYDGGRRLTAVADPLGHETRYTRDNVGRPTAVTSPLGRTTRYQYDAAGRTLDTTKPSGAKTTYTYSAAGLLLTVSDPTGAVTRNQYDAARHLTSSTDPLGRTTTYTYNADGNLSTSTNVLGAPSRYSYDQFGRISTVTDPAGTQIRYAYDADGRQTERTQPAGTTATSYDSRGNVASTTDALGRTTRYEYDASSRVVAVTDPTGAVWRTTYDANGRVVARTDPLGHATLYEYDAAGRLTKVTDPLGHATTYIYDAAGQLIRVVNALGGVTTLTYDEDGNHTSTTSPAGLVSRFSYDENRQRITYTDPRGGITRYAYNARGQRISTTTPSGAVNRVEYDGAYQLVRAIDPNGHATGYGYDGMGNLTTLTEPSGSVTRFAYDTAGRQVSSTDPLGRVTRQAYDAAGNLTTVTDPDGRTTRLVYDAASQLVQRVAPDGATIAFAYDAAGRRSGMTDGMGTMRYSYDAAGRLTSHTQPDGRVFALDYDAANRRTGLRYPDGLTIGYTYDASNRLTGLSDSRAGTAGYTLDPDGRVLTEALPGGWTRAYTYTAGLLSRYREARGSSSTQDSALTRDVEGRIVRQAGPSQDLTYTYDPAGQILTVTGQPGGALTLAYDANGNRTGIKRAGVESVLAYDAADQLLSIDTGPKHVAYTYDQSGRLLTRVGRDAPLNVTYDTLTVGYDSFGRIGSKVRTKGGVTRTAHYTNNGDGLPTRVETTREPGNPPPLEETQLFTWSAGDPVPQILTANDTDFTYGYGRVTLDSPTGSATFSRDVYGSTIRTSETAAWAQSGRYDVFGDAENANQPALTVPGFGYRGELSDDDSVFLRSRDYDTTVGRFSSRDPADVLVGQTDPDSPYVYANNNPVNFVDPMGEFALSDVIGQILAALFQVPGGQGFDCDDDDPGNSIKRHDKCFQGLGPLRTRGYISEDCLNADPNCLETLYQTRRPERAAQAFTINELNRRREGWWDRFWDDQLEGGTTVSKNVDWEVGNSDTDADIGFAGFRIDITTDERNIFEVKRYEGPATTTEVTAQLARYISTASLWYGIIFVPGTELQDWANAFIVYSNWFKRQFDVGGDLVYVWGMENPAGHVYFAEKDKAPANVRAAAEVKRNADGDQKPCNICVDVPPILIPIIRVPVPV